MNLTPQHKKILNLLSDGVWHCGTEILQLFIKDDRKRISELKQMGYEIISAKCDCGKHNSNTVKRRLIIKESAIVKEFREEFASRIKPEQLSFL